MDISKFLPDFRRTNVVDRCARPCTLTSTATCPQSLFACAQEINNTAMTHRSTLPQSLLACA